MSAFLEGGSSPGAEPSPTGDDGPGEVCIANIGPRERRKRLLVGVVAFAAGLVVLAALMFLVGIAGGGWRLCPCSLAQRRASFNGARRPELLWLREVRAI